MNYRTTNKVLAGVVLVVALLTYLLTLQPSVPFWDCGEFAAAAMWQQVPHPPGAPLWLLVGKTFEIAMPGDPGHNFNFFAALCSAIAAMFAYLIAVNAFERFRPYKKEKPLSEYIPTFAGALIGALAFVWSDSNWFNSVESEVYSAATLLAAMAMWMMMKWDQNAEKPGHERWLLLIAYVMGLAIGVHLLALLIIPSVALAIYYKQNRKVTLKGLAITGAITGVSFYLLYNGTLAWIPNALSASMIGGIVILAALVGLAGWAYATKNTMVFLAAASFTLVVLGYTTYTQILVRSAAHPVMNENEPDTFDELARYLGREQYGSRASWPRRHDHIRGGFYQRSLEQYGPLPRPVGQNPDGSIEWENIDAGAELGYLIDYQMGHMYFRYLGWNFVGRVSDVQDAPISWFGGASEQEQMQFIRPTGAGDVFPVSFFALPFILGLIGIVVHFKRDWRMATIFMSAFLLWGVLMALQQNQQNPQPRERDYFYTASFMVFAIWTGFGAFGLAESFGRKPAGDDPEGDDLAMPPLNVGVAGGILGLCLIAGPLNMAYNGWTLHDRSGNWLPFDYAYNLLQSCEKNAILFTNGDNDTFPVWYLQDVAAVRRDVRVVNLELAQTPWYIWQMKFEPTWDAAPVPLTFSAEMIRDNGSGRNQINGGAGDPEVVRLPVPASVMEEATNGEVKSAGEMVWTFTPGQDGRFTPKNQIVRSIMTATALEGWKRPLYFSVTAGNEYAGLMNYLRQEGMAYRVMPVKQAGLNLDIEVMKKSLLEPVEGDEYFTEQNYGFKFRNLNNRDVYFLGQDDHRRPMNLFYHQLYITLAEQLLYLKDDRAGAIEVLDKMVELIPPDRFGPPVPYGESYSFYTKLAELYRDAGATDKARVWAQEALDQVEAVSSTGVSPRYISQEDYQPNYVYAKARAIMGDYEAALSAYSDILSRAPNDQNAQVDRDAILIEQALSSGDTSAARDRLLEAVTSYGSPEDMRAQVLLSRFPELFASYAAPLATAEEDGTEVEGGE